MKNLNVLKGVLVPLFLFITFHSCSEKMNTVTCSGIVEPAGLTSYQYGTHRLTSSDTLFALRSSKIDLTKYENKKVMIYGKKVDGYPLEGGPVFVEVSKIKIIQNE